MNRGTEGTSRLHRNEAEGKSMLNRSDTEVDVKPDIKSKMDRSEIEMISSCNRVELEVDSKVKAL